MDHRAVDGSRKDACRPPGTGRLRLGQPAISDRIRPGVANRRTSPLGSWQIGSQRGNRPGSDPAVTSQPRKNGRRVFPSDCRATWGGRCTVACRSRSPARRPDPYGSCSGRFLKSREAPRTAGTPGVVRRPSRREPSCGYGRRLPRSHRAEQQISDDTGMSDSGVSGRLFLPCRTAFPRLPTRRTPRRRTRRPTFPRNPDDRLATARLGLGHRRRPVALLRWQPVAFPRGRPGSGSHGSPAPNPAIGRASGLRRNHLHRNQRTGSTALGKVRSSRNSHDLRTRRASDIYQADSRLSWILRLDRKRFLRATTQPDVRSRPARHRGRNAQFG